MKVNGYEIKAGANLRGADLEGTNLRDVNLSYADLRRANLEGADLRGADLSYADLRLANLEGANLYGAYLRGANLYDADLEGANLSFCKDIVSFCLEKHLGILYKHNKTHYIQLGCKNHPVTYWLEHYVSIGQKSGYDKDEIEVYGMIIKTLSEMTISKGA